MDWEALFQCPKYGCFFVPNLLVTEKGLHKICLGERLTQVYSQESTVVSEGVYVVPVPQMVAHMVLQAIYKWVAASALACDGNHDGDVKKASLYRGPFFTGDHFLQGTIFYTRGPFFTQGDHFLHKGTIFYTRGPFFTHYNTLVLSFYPPSLPLSFVLL